MASGADSRRVVLGGISAAHGVQGWVKIVSYTDPPENILRYDNLLVGKSEEWRRLEVEVGRRHGRWMLVKLSGIDDRDAALELVGHELAVYRSELPATAENEYYWVDLIGLRVETTEGDALGQIVRLMESEGQQVLVIEGDRERLIPIIRGQTVREVDLEKGVMRVEWDPEF